MPQLLPAVTLSTSCETHYRTGVRPESPVTTILLAAFAWSGTAAVLLAVVPLFGDGLDAGQVAAIVTLSGVAGGGIQWATNRAIGLWQDRKNEKKGEQRTIVDHLQAAVTRLQRQGEAQSKKIERLQQQGVHNKILVASLLGHVRHLELLLRGKGIEFVPWEQPDYIFSDDDENPRSDPHRPGGGNDEPG